MPILIVRHDDRQQEIPLDAENFLIGRDPTNTLVLGDSRVSRFHCRLRRLGASYKLEDLDSASGTLLGGRRVTEALLEHGQTFTVGAARIQFHSPPGAMVASAPCEEQGLYVVGGPLAGEVAVWSDTLQIGRAPDCELVLDGPLVSNYHCSIQLLPDGAVLQDLGSTNGTRVGGVAAERVRLAEGDEVTVGEHRMLFAPYPPRPLDARPDAVAPLRRAIELGLFAAVCLLLWGLLVGLVIRPLLARPEAPAATGTIPFAELDDDQLPRHYRFESDGSCEISFLRGPQGGLRLRGQSFAGKEFRLLVRQPQAIGEGWLLFGAARAVRGASSASLFAEYTDREGRLLLRLHGPLVPLGGGATALEARFGPCPGAAEVRFGCAVAGTLEELLLSPLRLAPARVPAPAEHELQTPAGALLLLPGGDTVWHGGGRPRLSLEFAALEQGELAGSTRYVELGSRVEQGAGLSFQATQVGPPPGTRGPYSLTLERTEQGALVRYEGTAATHLKWRWLEAPGRVALFYRGTPVAETGQRLLTDEMVLRWQGIETTCRFEPPVYRESRWQEGGVEFWQLRFAEQLRRLTVRIERGDRQRRRELERLRDRYLKARLRKDLPAAIRLLERWTALAGPRATPELDLQRQQLGREARELQQQTLLARGAEGRRLLAETLDKLRGTIHEGELARRELQELPEGERRALAGALLARARSLAVEGYLHLARAGLALVVQSFPETPAGAQAVALLARLHD